MRELRDKKHQDSNKEEIKRVACHTLIAHSNPNSVNTEHFRAIRTNILFAQRSLGMKTLLVTSSVLTEGKSTVSANLAYVMAQVKKKVLIIDADLRKPTIHEIFKLDNEVGLTTLLVSESVKFEDVIQYDSELNLHILTSGPLPSNPAELLVSDQMHSLMRDLSWRFDFIIYDTPPATAVTEASILATDIDSVLFVVRHGYTNKDEVRSAIKVLESVKVNILGFVFNDQPAPEMTKRKRYYK